MSWGGDPSIAQALTRFGAQPAALTVFDHLTKFSLGVPVEEASLADLACSLWAQRFGREGFLCQGNRGLCSDLVGVIEAAGGTVQTQRPVRRILMEGGRAVGVETEAGEVLRGRPVISNAGAAHTATLLGDATPGWFRQRLEAAVPALGVAHSVRSRQPLHDHSSIEIPCDLPHISGMAPISRLCPALAPPEWHYTLAYQALDRRLPLDEQVDAGVRELQGHFGSGAEVFNSALYRGTHPAAALAQSVGQHGGARFPLGVPEIRDLHLVGHDVAGHGIAAEVIGSSCLRLRRVLR
jgi:phytoene dehydrogenase-like protein